MSIDIHESALKARLRVSGGKEVEIAIVKGEDVLAGLSLTEAEEFGVVLHEAVALHLRGEGS